MQRTTRKGTEGGFQLMVRGETETLSPRAYKELNSAANHVSLQANASLFESQMSFQPQLTPTPQLQRPR